MRRTILDEQLTDMLRGQRKEVPQDVHDRIAQFLSSLPDRRTSRRRQTWSALALACAVLLVACASLFVTSSNSFAETIRLKLQSIFFEYGDPGRVQEQNNTDKDILKEVKDKGYTLRIHEVMFDGMRLSFSYSLAHDDRIPQKVWVVPAFQMDGTLKQDYPGIVMTDSGGIRGDQKTGIVNYYFTGSSPENFTLKIKLNQIAIFDDPSNQQMTNGNWNFQIPVERKGQVKDNVLTAPLGMDRDDTQFQVVRIRTAERSTLWNFRWEFPEKLVPNALNDDEPRYDIKYAMIADGHIMNFITFDSREHGRLRRNGEPVPGRHYSTDMLVTEMLPERAKEVTITPILRTGIKSATSGLWSYTEKRLDEFTVTVPLV
jgi:hypothetical protein